MYLKNVSCIYMMKFEIVMTNFNIIFMDSATVGDELNDLAVEIGTLYLNKFRIFS